MFTITTHVISPLSECKLTEKTISFFSFVFSQSFIYLHITLQVTYSFLKFWTVLCLLKSERKNPNRVSKRTTEELIQIYYNKKINKKKCIHEKRLSKPEKQQKMTNICKTFCGSQLIFFVCTFCLLLMKQSRIFYCHYLLSSNYICHPPAN